MACIVVRMEEASASRCRRAPLRRQSLRLPSPAASSLGQVEIRLGRSIRYRDEAATQRAEAGELRGFGCGRSRSRFQIGLAPAAAAAAWRARWSSSSCARSRLRLWNWTTGGYISALLCRSATMYSKVGRRGRRRNRRRGGFSGGRVGVGTGGLAGVCRLFFGVAVCRCKGGCELGAGVDAELAVDL